MSNQINDQSRRKAVKTIVGSVAAIAAYNVLPAKWGVPIIEQVFLPAHAATSGSSDPLYYRHVGTGDAWTSLEPESNFMGMLADAGEAVSNFIVSEAHAVGIDYFSWYLTVIGDQVTVSTRTKGRCSTGTGPSAVGSEIALFANFTIVIYSNTLDTIEIGFYGGSDRVACKRSDSAGPTCVDVPR